MGSAGRRMSRPVPKMRAERNGAPGLVRGFKTQEGSNDGDARTKREALAADGLQGRRGIVSGDVQFSWCGASVGQEFEKVSLVDAWKRKMTRQDADHVLISYQPLMSSALKYPGANIKSDGKTLRVSLPKCLVTLNCPVMVDGDGPVVEELRLTR